MAWLEWGDFYDVYYKILVDGSEKIRQRLHWSGTERVKQTWAMDDAGQAHWWIIPEIQQRWNTLISGNPDLPYESYIYEKYLKDREDLRMFSPGCGTGVHELRFAAYPCFSEIRACDIASEPIAFAIQEAEKYKYSHLHYELADMYQMELPSDHYDFVLFHASLHHFKELPHLLKEIILPSMKPGALLIIHEYVGPNRFQWTDDQLSNINRILNELEPRYRLRSDSRTLKKKVYRPGKFRMWLSDPSEAVASEEILPLLHKYCDVLEEKSLGGNLLHLLFRDIAFNFLSQEKKTQDLLMKLFQAEDDYLAQGIQGDFCFGVYQKRIS